jgi:hypothetical protein
MQHIGEGLYGWSDLAGTKQHGLDPYSGGVGGLVGYSTEVADEEQAMEVSGGTDMSDGKCYYFHTQDPGESLAVL